jgi:hypothetical protein
VPGAEHPDGGPRAGRAARLDRGVERCLGQRSGLAPPAEQLPQLTPRVAQPRLPHLVDCRLLAAVTRGDEPPPRPAGQPSPVSAATAPFGISSEPRCLRAGQHGRSAQPDVVAVARTLFGADGHIGAEAALQRGQQQLKQRPTQQRRTGVLQRGPDDCRVTGARLGKRAAGRHDGRAEEATWTNPSPPSACRPQGCPILPPRRGPLSA